MTTYTKKPAKKPTKKKKKKKTAKKKASGGDKGKTIQKTTGPLTPAKKKKVLGRTPGIETGLPSDTHEPIKGVETVATLPDVPSGVVHPSEVLREFRLYRLESYQQHGYPGHPTKTSEMDKVPSRTNMRKPVVAKAIPLTDSNARDLPQVSKRALRKIGKETDYLSAIKAGTEMMLQPEYDLLEPYVLLDTESFFLQAIRRRLSLMFRNGFEINGTDKTFVEIINKRFNQLSFMQRQTMQSLFKEVLRQLLISSNCIVVKIRDLDASGGKKNPKNRDRVPVAAYKVVPVHTMYPVIDDNGVLIRWMRFFGGGGLPKKYPVEDVIFFHFDRKPGHFFGTPRTISVRDDILALRRLEENVELLLINHLFPLMHVKVGTETAPADFLATGISEVDYIKSEIENMPKEGVFVTDDRIALDVVGAKGASLDPTEIVSHYKKRIFTGLGMSGIDMGEADTSNRSTADNVSQNLKDTVKDDLDSFCGQVKMEIFRELFMETAREDLSVQNAVADVNLVFPEIDVDNMIKWENHITNMFNNNMLDADESRLKINKQPMTSKQKNNTHYKLHVLDLALRVAKIKSTLSGQPAANAVSTLDKPKNQHKTNLDPSRCSQRSSAAQSV